MSALKDGLSRIRSNMQSQKKKGSLKEDQAASAMSRIKGVLTYDEFWTVDMVIEAVIEDIALKQRIFVDLEKACSSQCILSSNTSTINLDLIGAKTRSADRIVGAHFFSPAHIMPLLEIVRSQDTSPQVGWPTSVQLESNQLARGSEQIYVTLRVSGAARYTRGCQQDQEDSSHRGKLHWVLRQQSVLSIHNGSSLSHRPRDESL